MRLVRLMALALMIAAGWTRAIPQTGGSPGKSPGADKLVAEGRASFEKGDYGEALLKFEEAVKNGASGGELYYQMGVCFQTVRADAVSSKAYMEKAAPLLESRLKEPGGKDLKTYYYLGSILLSDVPDATKLSQVSSEAIAAVESGTLRPTRPEEYFQVGKLYGFQGKRDKAAANYEKAIGLIGDDPAPAIRSTYLYCLSAAGQLAMEKQQWDKAADLFGRLAKADPSREEAHLLHPLCLFRAGKEIEAAERWEKSPVVRIMEEKAYLGRIARHYVELGKPQVTAPGPDQELKKAIADAGRKYADARVPDDAAAKEAADKWLQEQVEARKARKKAAAADEGIAWDPPVPPQSAERVAAEKNFFGLLAELVRRGQPVRDYALTAGLAQLIFK